MSNPDINPLPAAEPEPEPEAGSEPEDAPASADPATTTPTPPSDSKGPPIKLTTPRPTGLSRTSTQQSQFMKMLLGQHEIPRIHNILASFFTWILLAGFVVVPGAVNDIPPNKIPINQTILLILAYVCVGIGAVGMLWLWWMWRRNYVWLLNKIFLPGCLNSAAGLLSTLVNIYSTPTGSSATSNSAGNWTTKAKITVCIMGGSMVVTGALFVIYEFWILRKVKNRHTREMASGAATTAARDGKGFVKKMVGMAMESSLEPESVV